MRWLVLLGTVTLAHPALAQTFEFKGVSLGTIVPTAVIEQKLGVVCRKPEGDQACSGETTLLSLPAKVYLDILNGAVARIDISFQPMLFVETAKSLNEKYGRPFREKRGLITWRNKRGDLVILEQEGLLSYSSIEDQVKTNAAVHNMKKDF